MSKLVSLIALSSVVSSNEVTLMQEDFDFDSYAYSTNYYTGYAQFTNLDEMAYQENLNYDYMTYDRYTAFKP